MTRRADPYDWSGGHPALDFVNTLDERPSDAPIENLATYDALVRFAGLAGLIERPASERFQPLKGAAGTRIARRARELREHLYAILAANYARQPVPQGSLDSIALEVRRAHAARAFTPAGASRVAKHRWLSPTSPEVPLHACALAVENLLVTADRSSDSQVRSLRLRGLLHRHEQGAPTAVVQHAELWQPRKTKALAQGS